MFILIIVQRDATQNNLYIRLQVHSTCFGCQPHASSVHKTITTASRTCHSLERGQASLATLEGGSWAKILIITEDCSYSFVYS